MKTDPSDPWKAYRDQEERLVSRRSLGFETRILSRLQARPAPFFQLTAKLALPTLALSVFIGGLSLQAWQTFAMQGWFAELELLFFL
ncbi:MAG: hypothetical protein ACFCU3_07285 [Verrucomicrobiales bacterium]